ncbi:YqhR family membrane protein [Evansella sp. LMS18]|uniref:YqhR family membrane protein n=1 Tax=Evansella sp. LMS18 TaxID=2924033 RepID=UPI0020D1F36E|nr:YqhR family membrane protein [Evansella sp. LMS18]UTR09456.1 YqhR family membrane protein [Evansella sp. LMS18]
MGSNELEQNETEKEMSFNAVIAITGFVGGLFWSLISYLAFYLNFSRVGPALVLMPWALGEWKETWIGQLVSIGVISVLSIGIAFGYRLIFVKINKPWPGLLYGVGLWGFIFIILNPVFPGLKPIMSLDINTLVTNLCLFAVYGLFIGYSISYEYHERTEHEGETIQS